MNESGEPEREVTTDGTETSAPDSTVDSPESEPKKTRTDDVRATAATSETVAASPPLPSFDFEPESFRSWEANARPAPPADMPTANANMQWSASEVTVVHPPLVPEERDSPRSFPPPIALQDETSNVQISNRNVSRPLPRPSPFPPGLRPTRTGIELGRPLFAVAAIGVLIALAAWMFAGAHQAGGVAVGASTAALNFWAFTRIGTGFFSRRGLRASFGLLAGAKLLVLFGGVAVLLKMQITDPVTFLLGYLALPVVIVASQLLGLQPDFEEGDGPG
jgi:hypothetical protein